MVRSIGLNFFFPCSAEIMSGNFPALTESLNILGFRLNIFQEHLCQPINQVDFVPVSQGNKST